MEAIEDVDYLVVGAGAMGMAFVDALTDRADVSVAIVDRRHGAGGHWLDAYGFVRLHQASAFYGSRPRCSAAAACSPRARSADCTNGPARRRSASTTRACWRA